MSEHFRALCRLDTLADGEAKGFQGPEGSFTGVFAIRQGDTAVAYVNACPHIGTPLDWVPDRFLSRDGTRIICATHGAEFRINDGFCTRGPCSGDSLEPLLIKINEGTLFVADKRDP